MVDLQELVEKVRIQKPMAAFEMLTYGVNHDILPQVKVDAFFNEEDQFFPSSIPQRIVQYWHSLDMPDDVKIQRERLEAFHPKYECKIFHHEEARSFIGQHFGHIVQSLFDECFHPAMEADFWRICELYINGGIYVDVDVECIAPLPYITAGKEFNCFLFYAIGGPPWCIENGFIVTQPKHAAINAILELILYNVQLYKNTGIFENIWVGTGPGATTMGVMGYVAKCLAHNLEDRDFNGLLLAHNSRSGVSYRHVDMNYKHEAGGDWRLIDKPSRSS